MIWIAPSEKDTTNGTLEKRLWDSADQFRANSGQVKCRIAKCEVRSAKAIQFGSRSSPFVIPPARRLAIMNLAIRGIEADIGKEHADTFRNVQHPNLRADYVLANPPFNESDTTLRACALLLCDTTMEALSIATDNYGKESDRLTPLASRRRKNHGSYPDAFALPRMTTLQT